MKKNFNEDYVVYDDGRIFSNKCNRFLAHDVGKLGYHQVTLFINRKPIHKKVHRLVAYLFCNPPKNYKDLSVNHIDGNKDNNSYENLEWCTQAYNNKHARDTGLNNISRSNSERWLSSEFRERVSKKLSETNSDGRRKGKKNPMFRYSLFDSDGNEYDLEGLGKLIGLKYSGSYRLVRKFLSTGFMDPRLKARGIIVKDIKEKGASTIESASGEKVS